MSSYATLGELAAALREAGYSIARSELAGVPVVLAESSYAAIACMEASDYNEIATTVSDVQAALTQKGAEAPSARMWDLYLFIHVLIPPAGRDDEAVLESIASDTRYTRKFIRVAIADTADAIDRALRPLLPLRRLPDLTPRDPLSALEEELARELPPSLAAAAVRSFKDHDHVTPR